MLFNGEGEAFNVGAFLEAISPYAWATTGIALCIGLSVVGAAWSVDTFSNCKTPCMDRES
jgi:V-type H+-transporting ATPase proteolipid subunit